MISFFIIINYQVSLIVEFSLLGKYFDIDIFIIIMTDNDNIAFLRKGQKTFYCSNI